MGCAGDTYEDTHTDYTDRLITPFLTARLQQGWKERALIMWPPLKGTRRVQGDWKKKEKSIWHACIFHETIHLLPTYLFLRVV